jgi:epoxyqueuosine reductase
MSSPINSATAQKNEDLGAVMQALQHRATELGFSQIGVAHIDLTSAEPGLEAWLSAGFHGTMHYMQQHGLKRARPTELVPGTVSVLTLRMNYLPRNTLPGWQAVEWQQIETPLHAQVSLYARGRDYHKVLRQRLQQLADELASQIAPLNYRVFTDSAPVLEVELATRSGQGWRGKHTLALRRDAGSMFFLGEIFVDAPLPFTPADSAHCGTCQACMDICPTRAIIAPYRLDARRCISYLTIEHVGSIPEEFRSLIGNRIYGCDDCQLVCPWNKFAQPTTVTDFDSRPVLAKASLLDLWHWTEAEFLHHTQGTPIRRIGFERWQRNLAVGLGNALRELNDHTSQQSIQKALTQKLATVTPLVNEHIRWALQQAPSLAT